MGSNPINLAFRFLLELCAIGAFAYWGWTQHDGVLRIVLAIVAPLIGMTIWGVFKVEEDPSNNGKAPVKVAGIIRLLIELALFGFAVLLLNISGQTSLSTVFLIAVIVHYLLSYDRVIWLIHQ